MLGGWFSVEGGRALPPVRWMFDLYCACVMRAARCREPAKLGGHLLIWGVACQAWGLPVDFGCHFLMEEVIYRFGRSH